MASPVATAAAAAGERILVLAPLGRDAQVLCELLGRAGLATVPCGEMSDLASALHDGAGALLLTEEALAAEPLRSLLGLLSAQPTWSDLPLVLLASAEPLEPDSCQAVAALRASGSVTVLERPVRGLTLVTAVQTALRARRHQYQIRDLVERERSARQTAETASQVRDEFLATVSHELRTPLGAILLWTRLLQNGQLDQQNVQRAFQALERSAEAQSKLIEDLLDVSRMTLGKLSLSLREVSLAQVVQAAVDIIRPAAEAKRIRVEAAVDPHLDPVRADPDRLQQVLWNLLSNAVKFTPPGGRVSIRLTRQADRVRIEVADTGKGIDPRFLPHVFERFRQADATSRRLETGLGIGLAISRQLVELHGGTLRAESPGEGLGSVFTLDLPLTAALPTRAAAPASTRRQARAAVRRSLSGIRVLLVEDDAATRHALALTLEQHDAEVTAVDSAAAALAALAAGPRESAGPQVLVSDLGMPGMDGHELLRRVRALEAERGAPVLPAILITAYALPDDRARALASGFAAHLPKPVEPEELVTTIEQLARQDG